MTSKPLEPNSRNLQVDAEVVVVGKKQEAEIKHAGPTAAALTGGGSDGKLLLLK